MSNTIAAILDLDSLSFYLVVGLSMLWSYFIYETTNSWLTGVISVPLFTVSSLISIYVLEQNGIYLGAKGKTDILLGTAVGAIVGFIATFIAIRMLMNISGAQLRASQKKEAEAKL